MSKLTVTPPATKSCKINRNTNYAHFILWHFLEDSIFRCASSPFNSDVGKENLVALDEFLAVWSKTSLCVANFAAVLSMRHFYGDVNVQSYRLTVPINLNLGIQRKGLQNFSFIFIYSNIENINLNTGKWRISVHLVQIWV